MGKKPVPFKKPPQKYWPRGLGLLYEDRDILVVDKVSGLLTMGSDSIKENTAYYLLNEYVSKGNSKSRHRIFIVHRLDRNTSGVLIFAKNEAAKNFLQQQWQGFQKKYYALVHGNLKGKEGVISSYLAENSAYRMYAVTDPKQGKLAKTGYKVLRASAKHSYLEIDLLTGKKNQIRVQLADQGCPVVGDRKYGKNKRGPKRLLLHAASLKIVHPYSKDEMSFTAKLPPYFETSIKELT